MDFEKLKDIRNSTNPFAQQLGIWVEEIREGYARVTKTVGPDDLNPVNAPHGGVYFSMADTVSGSAMASHGYYAVTVNASYNYLRSGSVGDVFTCLLYTSVPPAPGHPHPPHTQDGSRRRC